MDKIEKLYFNAEAFNDPDNTFAFFKAGYEAKEPDPWDMVPVIPLKMGNCIRKLVFGQRRMHWQMNEYFGTTIEDKIGCMVASGYNCDPTRDGETRVFKDGKWINE